MKTKTANRKRRIKDILRQAITWILSSFYGIILIAILSFIFRTGWTTLTPAMLKNNYRAENIMAAFDRETEEKAEKHFQPPETLPENAAFSSRYGIALVDGISHEKERYIQVVWIDPDSPLRTAHITTAGPNQGQPCAVESGMHIKKIRYLDAEGETKSAGIIQGQDAASCVESIENSQYLLDYYAQTGGGGIRGALYATLILIGLTLVIALPIGIFAAVYLHELAPDNRLTNLLRTCIDLLNGVPSIIFGLMGMTVFFPITQLFGVTTQSILLGALTMAVILLPTIIRQTEEALNDVPVSVRMGSLSLGATQTQTIFKLVLPAATGGILSAALLSISRVVGESAALIYTMGASLNDYPAWDQSGASLAVHIWSIMSGEQPNFELASAISIFILAIVLFLNLIVKTMTLRLSAKRRGHSAN